MVSPIVFEAFEFIFCKRLIFLDDEEIEEERNLHNPKPKRPKRSKQNFVKAELKEINSENNFFNLSHVSTESASDNEEQNELHIPTYDELVKMN